MYAIRSYYDPIIEDYDEADRDLISSKLSESKNVLGGLNRTRVLADRQVQEALLRIEENARVLREVMAEIAEQRPETINNLQAARRAADNFRIVITSYSIHYTKLYDAAKERRGTPD